MNRTIRTLLLVALLFSGYGSAWGIPFQCLVGMRDGTNEKVVVDTDSEQRAKEMAVQKFGQRAWGMMSVGCAPVAQQQVPTWKAPDDPQAVAIKQILDQNPQLSTVPGWPSSTSAFYSEFHRGLNIANCHMDQFPKPKGFGQLVVTNKHRCIKATMNLGKEVWQSGPKSKTFILVLYPETPRVWRVYDGKLDSSTPDGYVMLAEFDMQGNRGATAGSARPVEPPQQVTNPEMRNEDSWFQITSNRHLRPYVDALKLSWPMDRHFKPSCLGDGTIINPKTADEHRRVKESGGGVCNDYISGLKEGPFAGTRWRIVFPSGMVSKIFKVEQNGALVLKERFDEHTHKPTMGLAQELGMSATATTSSASAPVAPSQGQPGDAAKDPAKQLEDALRNIFKPK